MLIDTDAAWYRLQTGTDCWFWEYWTSRCLVAYFSSQW